MNFTLKQKILLGYIVMISFTLLVGIYAILGLQELNKITSTIIFNDLAAGEKLTKLNDSVLAQDLYEKRYLTLQQAEAENLFWRRSREFKSLLLDIGKTELYLGKILESIGGA